MENTIITITAESISNFKDWLHLEERSEGTIAKYTRDLRQLSAWLANQPMTRESLTKWKEQLITDGLEPVTINSKLAAVNTYCRYLGLNLKIKFLRIQRRLFREEGRELKKHEYERLIAAAASQGDGRLTLLMETIASTGIRVSEVKYILSAIPSYPEADEFRNECFRAKGELTEATYQMAKQKMADMEWAEAYDLFESIESYKNSKIQMIECKEGMKKEELYRAAMEQENQGKFQDAGAAFEQLKDYRDSKRHALKNRRLVHGNKVRAIGKKHTGAAFANIALSSFYSLGCCVSFPNNILINLLWGIPLMIAAVVLTIVRSRYRPTKRMWTMMGVTFSAFVVLAACGAITYGFSDSVFSSLFYLLATAAIIL